MINLGFLAEGKLAAILIIPSSWGFQRAGYSPRTRTVCYTSAGFPTECNLHVIKHFFWRRCREERRFLQGESLMLNCLLCYCFALLYFCLHRFIKNTKKNSSFDSLHSVTFTLSSWAAHVYSRVFRLIPKKFDKLFKLYDIAINLALVCIDISPRIATKLAIGQLS
jgi:hypothetical protein